MGPVGIPLGMCPPWPWLFAVADDSGGGWVVGTSRIGLPTLGNKKNKNWLGAITKYQGQCKCMRLI